VYAQDLVQPLARVLLELGAERALVVHGDDGLDEVTITGPTHAALLADGEVHPLTLDPGQAGLAKAGIGELAGGDASENARIARDVLGGTRGPRRDVVVLNAGAALWVAGAASDLVSGVALADESLASGAAAEKLAALARVSSG
jgi:anthranilate phosphoribosyltransferase